MIRMKDGGVRLLLLVILIILVIVNGCQLLIFSYRTEAQESYTVYLPQVARRNICRVRLLEVEVDGRLRLRWESPDYQIGEPFPPPCGWVVVEAPLWLEFVGNAAIYEDGSWGVDWGGCDG